MIEEVSWHDMPHRKHRGGRPSANPYADSVRSLIQSPTNVRGEPRAFQNTVSADEVQRHVRWLYRIGQKENVTVRKEIYDNPNGVSVTLLYWVQPKITRQRKG